jgi:hypothetical protein
MALPVTARGREMAVGGTWAEGVAVEEVHGRCVSAIRLRNF